MDNSILKQPQGGGKIFIASGAGYTSKATTTMTVRAYNAEYVSVSSNKLTFLKDCTVQVNGGHSTVGASGPSNGSANSRYAGTYSGTLASGFAGYSCANYAGSFSKDYKKGNTLYFTTYGSNSGDNYASVVG